MKQLTIAIIDDSPDDRQELRRSLLVGSERRYTFHEADTGTRAVELLRRLERSGMKPDCVLLDQALPDCDGTTVAEELLDGREFPEFPIVVITGAANHAHLRKFMRSGALDYVSKAYLNPELLTQTIEKAIERHRLESSLRQKDAALRESEQRFRTLIEGANEGIWFIDLSGTTLFANERMAQMLGYSRDEMQGRCVEEFCFEDDIPLARARVGDCMKGRAEQFDFRFKHRNGDPVEVLACTNPQRNSNGVIVGGQGMFTDITAQKNAARRAALAHHITRIINKSDSMPATLPRILQAFREHLGASFAAYWSMRDDNLLHCDAYSFEKKDDDPLIKASCNLGLELNTGFLGKVWAQRETVWINALADDATCVRRDEALGAGLNGAVALPVIGSNGTVGVIECFTTRNLLRDLDWEQALFFIGFEIGQYIERSKAEAALQDSERRLRLTLEATDTGTWDWDLNTNAVFWSAECYAIHGVSPGTFEGTAEAFSRYLDKDDRDRVWKTVNAAIANHSKYECEFRIVRPNGEVRWVTNVGRAVYNEQGRPLRMVGTINDYTERKLSEDARLESEQRLRLALQAGNAGTFIHDLNTNRVEWSDQLERMLGYEPGKFGSTYQDFINHIHPEDAVGMAQIIRDAIERLEEYEFNARMIRVDGEIMWLSGRGRAYARSGSKADTITGVAFDVTEEKTAQDRLQISEERLRRASRVGRVGIFEWHINSDDAYWSPEACELFGHDRNAKVDFALWLGSLHPDDRECAAQVTKQIVERARTTGEGTYHDIFRVRHSDGKTIWLEASGAVELSGNELVMSGVVRDITERKRGEDALKDADRRKDDFIATLAHELRNPLAPIRNAVQILKMQRKSDPITHSAQDMIDRQLQHMVRLIDDLLDVSRITRGKMLLRRETVSLNDVLDQAIEASKPNIAAAGHDLNVQLPAVRIYLNADPVRLAQVFSNLLNNSCKYTEPGGKIRVNASMDGDDVILKVSDTGVGIAREHLHTLFDMFSQVDSALDRSQGGLGIGLSLVKGLVEMHGGTVVAASEGVGQGSEFTVRLPALAKGAPHESGDDLPAVEEPRESVHRILVVDDNPDCAESLALLLKLVGHVVEVAHDGLEAVKQAEQFKPDVVLLDIGMPRLNGYEACKLIRKQPWGEKMKLIALTGWGAESDKQRTQDAGFDTHLVKPVETNMLMRILAELPRAAR